jgi:hypothetical protein
MGTPRLRPDNAVEGKLLDGKQGGRDNFMARITQG